MKIPVLLYHNVGPQRAANQHLTIPTEKFAREMRWLARNGYSAIRPSEFVAWHRDGRPLPRKAVLLTFDDALADLCEHAFPVLERYGFSAAVFVVTEYVGQAVVWDKASGWPGLPCMTRAQIREWVGRGIEFGAHSQTHPDLRGLSADVLTREISGSRDALAEITGQKVRCFAYPYGFLDRASRDIAARAFDVSFSCEEGMNARDTDRAALLRTMVFPNDTWIDLRFRLTRGSTPLRGIRKRVGLRTRLRRGGRFFEES